MTARSLLMAATPYVPGLPPSLDLSFMIPGTLPTNVTFTRTTTATYFDSNGILQTAAINEPRWDYDPVTHQLLGLLLEEPRTNLILQSQFGASWTPSGLTLTANSATSPNGTVNAATILEDTSNAQHNIIQSLTKAATVQTYGVSLFSKQGVGTRTLTIQLDRGGIGGVKCIVNPSTGRVDSDVTPVGTGWTGTPVIVTALPNSWFKFAFSVTTDTNTIIRTIFNMTPVGSTNVTYAGDGVSNFQIYGYQIESGGYSTSYIPTTTVAVARVLDSATMPISVWYNSAQSSVVGEYMVNTVPNPTNRNMDVCGLSDNTSNNRLILRGQGGNSSSAFLLTSVAGSLVATPALPNVLMNITNKLGGSWTGTVVNGALNGSVPISVPQSLPAPGVLTTLMFGNDMPSINNAYLNGWLRRFRYWPRALSNYELQTVTT